MSLQKSVRHGLTKKVHLMDKVTINEVGPRDGLQNIENILSVDERLRLIRSLEQAGIELIEIGSFVNDKAVPAMSNTDELINKLGNIDNYSVLIPNKKGLDKAKDNGVKEICTVLCVTDSMNQEKYQSNSARNPK